MDITSYLLGKKAGGGGGGDLDWSTIGYSTTPKCITEGYNHAKDIYDNWNSATIIIDNAFTDDKALIIAPLIDTSNGTSMKNMFKNCTSLVEVPLIDTSEVIYTSSMFSGCVSLRKIPKFNFSKLTGGYNMFYNCGNLEDESLDNLLQSCAGATAYVDTKTISNMGIAKKYYSAEKIQALPHYQDFIDAGWTIGY